MGLNWIRTSTDKPETMVLVHGVGLDLTYWDRQIEALRERVNVVAFDLPGHGRSSGEPGDWTWEYGAAMIADLIAEVSPAPVNLVGISFGGMLAQVTTLARPELIKSLVLIGTAPAFPEDSRNGMRVRAETIRAGGMAAVLQPSLERWFTADTRAVRPDIIDRVTKTLLSDDPETQASIWELIATLNIENRLGEVRCPTLVLVGEHDPSTPPSVAGALGKAIPGATTMVIPNASHMVTVESPLAINDALIGFLGRV